MYKAGILENRNATKSVFFCDFKLDETNFLANMFMAVN